MSKDNWYGELKKYFASGLALGLCLAGAPAAQAGQDMGFYTGRALFDGANPPRAGVILKTPGSEPMKMKSILIITGAAAGGGAVAGVVLHHVGEGLSGMGAVWGMVTAKRTSDLRRIEWNSGPGPLKFAIGGAILAGAYALIVCNMPHIALKLREMRAKEGVKTK